MATTKTKKPVLVLPVIDYSARDAFAYPSGDWIREDMRIIAMQILIWKLEYYYGDSTSADDQQYDLWWNNLLYLEKKYPHLAEPHSVTENPGAPLPGTLALYMK